MIETNTDRITKILRSGGLLGSDHICKHYPCHFDGQDCTWCFCPFYPCNDELTDGKLVKSEWTGEMVWGCGNCIWIHKPDIAKLVLDGLRRAAKTFEKIPRKKLIKIRLKILKEGSSCR